MNTKTQSRPDAVRVLTYAGTEPEVERLARVIHGVCSREISEVGGGDAIVFDPVVQGVEALTDGVVAERAQILHIVSHASRQGHLEMTDIWGDLALTPVGIVDMLRERGVKVAIVTTCFGVEIARLLVDAQVVDLAVGCNVELSNDVALAFCRGFYRSLAGGRTPYQAAEDGRTSAAPRLREDERRRREERERRGLPAPEGGDLPLLEILERAGAYDDPMVDQPVFHIIGDPSEGHAEAIDTLIKELQPHRVFHLNRMRWGDLGPEQIAASIRNARVVMLLMEDDPIIDFELLDQVQAAINRLREGGRRGQRMPFRLFPLYLDGTRETVKPSKVPYGMQRLVPAFLNDRRLGGSYGALAESLKELI